MILPGLDLNLRSCFRHPAGKALAGGGDEHRCAGVRSSHKASTADHVSPLRRSSQRHSQSRSILVFRSVPLHGVRPTDVSREPARYRSLPARQPGKLYHMGIRSRVSRSTLADANQSRDWRIYADFAQSLIPIARCLYADDRFGVDLKDTVYALDATTIDLCLSLFPWAPFRSLKGAVKLHTLLDLRGNIPSFLVISDGKVHDVNILDLLLPEPGASYVMDRGYLDFDRLYQLHAASAFFVTRAKSNFVFQRRYSHPVDRITGVDQRSDRRAHQLLPQQGFDKPLRRFRFKDPTTGKNLVFLTNNFPLSPVTIADLYRCRWQVELFFKWIKQHLRIKAFFGTSQNAFKTQIWIAVPVYVLVAIVKKRLNIAASLYEILQILSLTMFERIPLDQLLSKIVSEQIPSDSLNQLNLFN